MKAKVLIPFEDKYTGKKHKKNDVLDITAARFNEILKKGNYVEAVDEPTPTPKKAEEGKEEKK